jgi:hypothetical protein
MSHLSIWTVTTMASVCGNEGYYHMGQLGLGNGAFDSNMVNLTIIAPALPFGFEIRV